MTTRLEELTDEYISVLISYFDTHDEAALTFAYELGRRALSEGLGVLDMAALHRAAVGALVLPAPRSTNPASPMRC